MTKDERDFLERCGMTVVKDHGSGVVEFTRAGEWGFVRPRLYMEWACDLTERFKAEYERRGGSILARIVRETSVKQPH